MASALASYPENPTPISRDSMTSGALLSLIARAHAISIAELLVTAQVAPRNLLLLLKELQKANLIEVKGLSDLKELDDLFARNQTRTEDRSEIPFLEDRRGLIGEIATKHPDLKVSISRRGFGRALAL
jgi:hypothetical protein